jgi:hypothetical protein
MEAKYEAAVAAKRKVHVVLVSNGPAIVAEVRYRFLVELVLLPE